MSAIILPGAWNLTCFVWKQIKEPVEKNSKKWSLYLNHVISTDLYSAVQLVSYLQYVSDNKTYNVVLEVLEPEEKELFTVSMN